jgi:hypothetical protein
MLGGEPPMVGELTVSVQAEHGLRVPDVGGEQHARK